MFHFSWKRVNEILMKFFSLAIFSGEVISRFDYARFINCISKRLSDDFAAIHPLHAEFLPQITFLRIFSFGSMSDVPSRRRYSPSLPPPLPSPPPSSLPSPFAFPFHLLNPSKSSPRRKFDAGRFQSTDLFFHIGIYFFTARCTE